MIVIKINIEPGVSLIAQVMRLSHPTVSSSRCANYYVLTPETYIYTIVLVQADCCVTPTKNTIKKVLL